MSDLTTAVYEIREHADDYWLAENYYWGRVAELFVSPTVKRALRHAVGGFDLNLARRPVDAVLDRLKITALAVPGGDQLLRRLVDQVWTPNSMDRYSRLVHWAALTFGDAYLIAWPGDTDGAVDLFYNSPTTTRVFYSEEDPRRKTYAAKTWCEGDRDNRVTRANLYYPDRVEKWISKAGSSAVEDADFVEFEVEGEPWPLPNPTGQVPVFHFRTRDPYGQPEHFGAFGPQNALTKLSATLMATIDFQGWPQRYALLKAGQDSFTAFDDDEETNPNDVESPLKSDPGGLWKLPNVEAVGQFQPATVQAFLDPMSAYIRFMAAATATPLRFFDPQGQIPSGEALRADEAPLAMRIGDRQAWFAEEWNNALVYAASLAGFSVPSVAVQWAPVQVVDDYQGWQAIALKVATGVPLDHALVEAGYPSDVVAEWMTARQTAAPGREAPPNGGTA
ncbi:MAG: phage portal protein [Actinomycetota bacterium]|nr:phage portal protein [Actinomycetota bacterium]